LGIPSAGAVEEESGRFPLPPEMPEAGGGITLAPGDIPAPLRLRELAPELVAVDGGGGTTSVAICVPLLLFVPPEFTVGGGGTTSLAPNIFPTRLLSRPLLDCDGGGGTTFFEGSGMLPPDKCRMS
jgi:hypothetical protein